MLYIWNKVCDRFSCLLRSFPWRTQSSHTHNTSLCWDRLCCSMVLWLKDHSILLVDCLLLVVVVWLVCWHRCCFVVVWPRRLMKLMTSLVQLMSMALIARLTWTSLVRNASSNLTSQLFAPLFRNSKTCLSSSWHGLPMVSLLLQRIECSSCSPLAAIHIYLEWKHIKTSSFKISTQSTKWNKKPCEMKLEEIRNKKWERRANFRNMVS